MTRKEEIQECDIAIDHMEGIEKIDTVDIDNYHGLSVKVVLVFSVDPQKPWKRMIY